MCYINSLFYLLIIGILREFNISGHVMQASSQNTGCPADTSSSRQGMGVNSPEICVKPALIFAAIETDVRQASLQNSSPQDIEHSPTQCSLNQQYTNL